MAKSDRSKSIKHKEDIDRISSLPEPLLSRILSSLPTKYAVATSILSTRWRFLWTYITNLEFDDDDAQQSYPINRDMNRMKFTLFVNRVLLLLNPPCLQNFQLKCHDSKLCDPLYLGLWVCAAMRLTVQKLELDLLMSESVELSLTHFYWKTLAVLKLKGDISFKVVEADSVSLPNLLTLHLSELRFTMDSNCSISLPCLKNLLLVRVWYTHTESLSKLVASSSSLESLTIHFSASVHNWHSSLQIDTPALKYLYVEDNNTLCCFTSENLSSLLEARIKIEFSEEPTSGYCTNIFNFIGGLCNVTFLSISGNTLEVFRHQYSPDIAPVFRNLSRLELDGYYCSCWSVVLDDFFGNMDNLEHLVLKVTRDDCHYCYYWLMDPSSVPMWLMRVSTICFTELIFECEDEVELVRHFLKNAKALKMLTVDRIVGTKDDRLRGMHKLLMSPRGSKECVVNVGMED